MASGDKLTVNHEKLCVVLLLPQLSARADRKLVNPSSLLYPLIRHHSTNTRPLTATVISPRPWITVLSEICRKTEQVVVLRRLSFPDCVHSFQEGTPCEREAGASIRGDSRSTLFFGGARLLDFVDSWNTNYPAAFSLRKDLGSSLIWFSFRHPCQRLKMGGGGVCEEPPRFLQPSFTFWWGSVAVICRSAWFTVLGLAREK
jgi:hypothetical protein